jgi:hypothetical protein
MFVCASRWASSCLIVLLCAGCGTSGRLDPTAAVNSPDDAYFVIGVGPGTLSTDGRPNETWAAVSDAEIEKGMATFRVSLGAGLVPFLDYTEEGYIVGKAHRGWDTLAIWELGPAARYTPCGSSETVVFKAPAGKVVYITNIDMHYNAFGDPQGSAGYMRVGFHSDIEAARAFLKVHYPLLADKLEMGSYQLMPCDRDPF